ncbi:MAG: class I SAM-dependent methyltransferase [Bdellovibrionales bacterium]|nr:class I SAM-dependent methyltransferase [Bdellovibrionales bacterium]
MASTQLDSPTGFTLDKTLERWQLTSHHHKNFKPFTINFNTGSYLQIYKKGVSKQDPLAKAIGVKLGKKKILDLTAGWLKDTWMLLNLGCTVTACENNRIVFELLQNAIEIDSKDTTYAKLFAHLQLKFINSLEFIKSENLSQWDVIYLDPMFPYRGKTALAGKEMQLLQKLIDSEDSPEALLSGVLQQKTKRVVVKRPLKGPELAAGVSFTVSGKSSRFDVYLN